MSTLVNKLEAVLFYRGEPETCSRLASILDVGEEEVKGAVEELALELQTRGIRLLRVGDAYELVTSPEASDVLQKLRSDALTRDMGRAGAETLAVVAYRGPMSRSRIEYIRGVNCSFVLRHLLIRGLVEKVKDPTNQKSVLYGPTPALLTHLGVTHVEELPDYAAVQRELDSFEKDTTLLGVDEAHALLDTMTENIQ